MNKKTLNNDLNRLDVDAFKSAKKNPIYLILEDVRSAQNVGAMFRTMDAFRGAGILLCGITATPPHREINKTALGATETVNWEYFEKTEAAIGQMRARNIPVFAVEQAESAIMLPALEVKSEVGIALILGNEVDGVSQKAIDLAIGVVEIPQFGTKHSLNVSVCAGIVLWHCMNHLNMQDL
jgi:tRNA G18 (ribose-2'-O)-methylase SpoU